jgi:hypothetical protein
MAFWQKARSEWHIFRIKAEADKPVWLIQKVKEPAKKITAKQERISVLTGRTIEEIAKVNGPIWQGKKSKEQLPRPAKKFNLVKAPARGKVRHT